MRGRRATFATFLVVLKSSLFFGCSPDGTVPEPAPTCLDAGVDPSCTSAYEPTYDALYRNTFRPSCAAPGVSCHASTGRQGGVDFGDPEAAYSALAQSKVRAGQPECSILVQRVVASSGKTQMPPGRSLSAGEQCAIVKWVADGARR